MPSTEPRQGSVFVGAAMVVLAGMVLTLAVGTWWVRAEVLDPERWTATSALVVADPEVRADVATELADRVIEAVRLEEVLAAALPFPLGLLADPLSEGAADLVARATVAGVATEAFAGIWEAASRVAWTEVLAAVRDEGDVTAIVDGALTLDLGRSLDLVREELSDAGVPAIDALDLSAVDARFVLVDAPELERLRQLVRAIDVGVVVFPVLVIALLGVGTVLLRRVGPVLVALGTGMVVGVVFTAVVAVWSRSVVVDAFSGGVLGPTAAGRVVDTVTEGVRTPLGSVMGAGAVLVVAGAVAWTAGARRRSPVDA